MSVTDLFASGLSVAVNRCLQFDSVSRQRLIELAGKVICLEITGLGLRVFVLPTPDELEIKSSYEGPVNVTLRGAPLAFARMGVSNESVDSLFAGEIQIEGDTGLGQRFGEILKDLDIDWEEMASRVMGDVLAHKLGEGVYAGLQWGREVKQSFEQNLAEYLQEELRQLPCREELEPFLSEVDRLRNDVERAEARINRLQQRHND